MRTALAVLAVMTAAHARAQETMLWSAQQYTSQNGLPQNSVVSMAMDRQGYLWFTTESGLVWFDGLTFHLPEQPRGAGAASERMREITPTADGHLLLMNAKGDLFDLNDRGIARSWPIPPATRSPRAVHGGVLSVDHMRRLIEQLEPLPGHDRWEGIHLTVLPVNATEWLIGGRECLLHYEGDRLRDTIPVPGGWTDLFTVGGSVYVVDARRELHRWVPGSDRLTPARLIGADLARIVKRPRLWLIDQRYGEVHAYLRDGATLYLMRPTTDPDTLRADKLPVELPTGCAVNDVLWSDEHHVLLVGTDTKGLFVYRERALRTRLCPSDQPGWNDAYYAMAPLDDHRVLALATDHRTLFDRDGCRQVWELPYSFNYECLRTLDDGRLALAHASELELWDPSGSRPSERTSLPDATRIFCFLERPEGLWVGHAHGIDRVKDGQVTPVMRSRGVTVMRQVGRSVWAGTCVGVLRYDTGTGAIDTIPEVRNSCVRSIELVGDRVFMGTYGAGAFVHHQGRTVKLPMDRQGYLTHVHSFMADGTGHLWISSNRGLFRVALSAIDAYLKGRTGQLYYAYYGTGDGIVNPEFNGGCDPAHVRLRDGRALFPTLEGLVEFDPDHVPDPVPKGRVFITQFVQDGVEQDLARPVRIPPTHDDLRIRFSLPYWGSPVNLQLEYRLGDLNDRWVPIGTYERELHFTRLPAGTYTLAIRKLGAPATEAPASIRFEVLTPYYRQRWFLALCGIASAVLLFLGIRVNEARLRRRNQELELAVRERTRAMELANEQLRRSVEVKERLVSIISHDIVTPLRFIARVARRTNAGHAGPDLHGDLRDIALSSDKLYANARNLLSWIKHQEGRIELRPMHVALNPLVEEALDVVRALASSQGARLVNDVPLDDVLRTDRDVVLIILQNLISNAVNYTREGEVRVLGEQRDDHYALSVCDTGPGMSPKALAHVRDILSGRHGRRGTEHGDPEMQGLGYVIIGELGALLGGSVDVDLRPGGGTTVTLRLPLRTEPPGPMA